MSRDVLLIGINSYNPLPRLNSPARDAEEIAKLLQMYGQFNVVKRLPLIKNKDNIIQVGKTLPVSAFELERAIGDFFNPEGKSVPDTALLFFSGHGVRKKSSGIYEGFLAASEYQP